MRSEKGITLVALIGIMVLLVVLAGVSISLVVTDGKSGEEQPSASQSQSEIVPVEEREAAESDIVEDVEENNVENEVKE